jgi:hypothetical protein
LNLAAPAFFVFLFGALLMLFVATGIIALPDGVNGQALDPTTALLVALDYGVISFTGWSVHKAKPWSRPLLLLLPVPLGLIGLADAQSSEISIGGLLVQNGANWILWIILMYWYLYRRENVIDYFQGHR